MTEDKVKTYEYEKQVKHYMNTYNLSEELAAQLLEEEVSRRLEARLLGHTEGQKKAKKESEKEKAELEAQFKKDFQNLYEYSEKLKTKIKNLSQDETRLKELLSQHIERTEVSHHKLALTDLQTANRDFSAGYCKALQDLTRHFEGIDYEIID